MKDVNSDTDTAKDFLLPVAIVYFLFPVSSLIILFSSSGGKKVGINPKINNLMPGYEAAKYGLVWICDSGIRGQNQNQNQLREALCVESDALLETWWWDPAGSRYGSGSAPSSL